jgi:hypothetical protein
MAQAQQLSKLADNDGGIFSPRISWLSAHDEATIISLFENRSIQHNNPDVVTKNARRKYTEFVLINVPQSHIRMS